MKQYITFHEAFNIVNHIPYSTVFSDYYGNPDNHVEEFSHKVYFSDDNINGEGYELVDINKGSVILDSWETEHGKWCIEITKNFTFLQLRDDSDEIVWQGRIYSNKVTVDDLINK